MGRIIALSYKTQFRRLTSIRGKPSMSYFGKYFGELDVWQGYERFISAKIFLCLFSVATYYTVYSKINISNTCVARRQEELLGTEL